MLEKLKEVRRKLSELQEQEADLVFAIIKSAGHDKIGQATYEIEGEHITIVTKENVTLDKAKLNVIWKETMPINRTYSYTLRKKDYDALMQNGTAAQRKLLAEIVTTKPAKPVVRIGG